MDKLPNINIQFTEEGFEMAVDLDWLILHDKTTLTEHGASHYNNFEELDDCEEEGLYEAINSIHSGAVNMLFELRNQGVIDCE